MGVKINWVLGGDLASTSIYGPLHESFKHLPNRRSAEALEAKLEDAAYTLGIAHLLTTEIIEDGD